MGMCFRHIAGSEFAPFALSAFVVGHVLITFAERYIYIKDSNNVESYHQRLVSGLAVTRLPFGSFVFFDSFQVIFAT